MLGKSFTAIAILMFACSVQAAPAPALAGEVERFEIINRSPAYGGTRFEEAGDYEIVTAVAHMRIDPRHAANRGIVDLDLAPAPDGAVHYKTDVIILRPREPAHASGAMVVEIPNRGNPLFLKMVNEGSFALDKAEAAGTGFTWRRGHTMVWIGWQGDIALAEDGVHAGAEFPVAGSPAKPITGLSAEEFVFDDMATTGTASLNYPAASMEQGDATLTVRANATSAPKTLPASAWRYKNPVTIEITRAGGFDGGAIYRFEYIARDPKVMGLGLAAMRDVSSFLKSGAPDGAGQPNPLLDMRPKVALVVGVSQSGRFLRDLLWEGFNADPHGGKVFDGAMALIAGSRKSFTNARFAQPGRYSTQHIDHITPGDQFPFTYTSTRDPVSGKTDGIFARCEASKTCPKLMHVDSNVEFWQGRASLVVTDGAGKDVALPGEVRAYLMGSTQHVFATTPSTGICKYPNNPARQAPLVRALLDDLVAWARTGKEPPPSRYPRLSASMLVRPERDAVGFPDLSKIGIGFPTVINALQVNDYSSFPPTVDTARKYEVLVPMTDADGHDIAAVRLPDVAVPLATHTGWNLRRTGFAENQLCGLNGLFVPLPAVLNPNDPRRPISERYPNRMAYAKAVAAAARALRDEGLLLDEDVNRYIERAKNDQRVPP